MKNKTVEYDAMQPQKEEVDVVMKELEKTGNSASSMAISVCMSIACG